MHTNVAVWFHKVLSTEASVVIRTQVPAITSITYAFPEK